MSKNKDEGEENIRSEVGKPADALLICRLSRLLGFGLSSEGLGQFPSPGRSRLPASVKVQGNSNLKFEECNCRTWHLSEERCLGQCDNSFRSISCLNRKGVSRAKSKPLGQIAWLVPWKYQQIEKGIFGVDTTSAIFINMSTLMSQL